MLAGLPPYGPPAIPMPIGNRQGHSEGLVVRFRPRLREPWVGNFRRGDTRFRFVATHPDGMHVLVVSDGFPYVVDPEDPLRTERVNAMAVRASEVPGWIILHTDSDFVAIGQAGVRWRSKRVSWDGLQDVCCDADAGVIRGMGFFDDDDWRPFEIRIRDGAVLRGDAW